jgi:N6-adenosine-specific RNA methylase IME4
VKYRTLLADPPWPFQWSGGKGGRRRRETELGYTTMPVADIAAMREPHEFAHPDGCNLFLWATDEMYREGHAVAVARAWGFEPVGPAIIWAKDNFGTGFFPRPGHEPLLVCRTRNVKAFWNRRESGEYVKEVVATHSVQHWGQERGPGNTGKQHSRKPEGAADLIEIVSPGPYLEMFARRTRFGWDSWGKEALNHVQIAESG